MAQVTLNSKDILSILTSLLNKVAQAISWVSQQQGSITIQLPDWGEGIRPLNDPTCYRGISAERAESEILLEMLKKMGEKGPQRPKAKSAK